ncbi:hypothetical protein ACMFMG_003808 [Clarireedia jacksonii]
MQIWYARIGLGDTGISRNGRDGIGFIGVDTELIRIRAGTHGFGIRDMDMDTMRLAFVVCLFVCLFVGLVVSSFIQHGIVCIVWFEIYTDRKRNRQKIGKLPDRRTDGRADDRHYFGKQVHLVGSMNGLDTF